MTNPMAGTTQLSNASPSVLPKIQNDRMIARGQNSEPSRSSHSMRRPRVSGGVGTTPSGGPTRMIPIEAIGRAFRPPGGPPASESGDPGAAALSFHGTLPKPILVGHDPKSADQAPVAFGIAAAQLTGAPLIVGSAHAGHATPPDVDAEFRALPGISTPRALHHAAEEIDAGLLVVGASTHAAAERMVHPSTAEHLLHGSPCPIAVVPSGWRPGGGLSVLGVAFTDTPEGHDALRGALAIARRAGGKLRVLSAAEPDGYSETYGGAPGVEPTTFSEIGGALRAATERAVDAATAGVRDIEVEPDVSVQDPADFLVAASHQLDLLVCGSHGHGAHRGVFLGSVTHRVTAEAFCPVIVLTHGAEATLEA